jgi:tRNA threonylcarbamoyladenosine biosynthesis protein TsaB
MTRRILAFDTSANVTSVAICEGSRVLHEDDSPSGDRHAETLLPRIEHALVASALTLEQIDLIAVGIGPGSFTGVRVGVASAKGFGLALGRPVCGVVSLSALALGASSSALPQGTIAAQGRWFAPLLDAFKGELFAALYRASESGLECALEPFHAAPHAALQRIEAIAPAAFALFGGGLRRYADELGELPARAFVLDERFDAPRARYVAQLGEEAIERGHVTPLAELAPRYVRDSDALLPKTPLRL